MNKIQLPQPQPTPAELELAEAVAKAEAQVRQLEAQYVAGLEELKLAQDNSGEEVMQGANPREVGSRIAALSAGVDAVAKAVEAAKRRLTDSQDGLARHQLEARAERYEKASKELSELHQAQIEEVLALVSAQRERDGVVLWSHDDRQPAEVKSWKITAGQIRAQIRQRPRGGQSIHPSDAPKPVNSHRKGWEVDGLEERPDVSMMGMKNDYVEGQMI